MLFVNELESFCGRKIHTIDIGGGLSTNFEQAPEPAEFAYKRYRKTLELAVPGKVVLCCIFGTFLFLNKFAELFSGRFNVITEMGCSLIQKAGKTLMRLANAKK